MPTRVPQVTINKVLEFHGHACPGCTRGIRIAEIALRELGDAEPLSAVVEVDNCSADAIRCMTGATEENGRLTIKLNDRHAFTLFRPSDGAAVRLIALPGYDAHWTDDERALVAKVRNHAGGKPTREDRAAFIEFWKVNSQRMLDVDEETILSVERLSDYRA